MGNIDCTLSPKPGFGAQDEFINRLEFGKSFLMLAEPDSTVPLKYIEHAVYGGPIIIYPEPYSICLRGTIIVLYDIGNWLLCVFA